MVTSWPPLNDSRPLDGIQPQLRSPGAWPGTIVAEVSKNYPQRDNPLALCQMFEQAIEHNRRRGYRLRDWQLSRVVGGDYINETIIAVFERAAR